MIDRRKTNKKIVEYSRQISRFDKRTNCSQFYHEHHLPPRVGWAIQNDLVIGSQFHHFKSLKRKNIYSPNMLCSWSESVLVAAFRDDFAFFDLINHSERYFGNYYFPLSINLHRSSHNLLICESHLLNLFSLESEKSQCLLIPELSEYIRRGVFLPASPEKICIAAYENGSAFVDAFKSVIFLKLDTSGECCDLDAHPDGLVALKEETKGVLLFDIRCREQVAEFGGYVGNASGVRFCNERQLVCAVNQESIKVWDLRKLEMLDELKIHEEVDEIDYHSSTGILMALSSQGYVFFYNLRERTSKPFFTGCANGSACFSESGKKAFFPGHLVSVGFYEINLLAPERGIMKLF